MGSTSSIIGFAEQMKGGLPVSMVPEAIESNKRLQEAMDGLQRALRRVVRLRTSHCASFAEHECAVHEALNDAGRAELQSELQLRSKRQARVFRFNGRRYKPHSVGEVTYHSLCGPLRVSRWVYRRRGGHNGPTLIPLELTAGLIERSTPAFAKGVARAQSKAPMRSYHEDLVAAHRKPPSRTTLERIASRLGEGVHESIDEIEPLVRQDEKLPDGAHAVAVGIDRTSVPMQEPRPAGAAPNSRRRKRVRPYVRKVPPPIDVCYRMAYVGTFCVFDRNGDLLLSRRYAVAAHEDPVELVQRAMDDVRHALAQQPKLYIGVVMDGAPELWGLLWDALDEQQLRHRAHQLIDRYHVNERLAAILSATEKNPDRRRRRLRRWNRKLDRDKYAMAAIDREIVQALTEFRGSMTTRRELWQHWNYLQARSRMHYATARQLGLPTSSGATEGACKSLIAARVKRSGQRWSREGVQRVLALRSLHQSERFDAYWPHFVRRQTCAALVGA